MEKCPLGTTTPLEFTADGISIADKDGFIWDTSIPDECRGCLHAALDNPAATTEFFEPEIFDYEDEGGLDKDITHGIKRTDESSVRVAMEEFGIEEGELYSRTAVEFHCLKETP